MGSACSSCCAGGAEEETVEESKSVEVDKTQVDPGLSKESKLEKQKVLQGKEEQKPLVIEKTQEIGLAENIILANKQFDSKERTNLTDLASSAAAPVAEKKSKEKVAAADLQKARSMLEKVRASSLKEKKPAVRANEGKKESDSGSEVDYWLTAEERKKSMMKEPTVDITLAPSNVRPLPVDSSAARSGMHAVDHVPKEAKEKSLVRAPSIGLAPTMEETKQKSQVQGVTNGRSKGMPKENKSASVLKQPIEPLNYGVLDRPGTPNVTSAAGNVAGKAPPHISYGVADRAAVRPAAGPQQSYGVADRPILKPSNAPQAYGVIDRPPSTQREKNRAGLQQSDSGKEGSSPKPSPAQSRTKSKVQQPPIAESYKLYG